MCSKTKRLENPLALTAQGQLKDGASTTPTTTCDLSKSLHNDPALVALDIGILCQCMAQVLLHIECCTRGAPLVLFLCFSGWEVLFELGSTSLRHLFFSSIHLSRQPQQVLAQASTQSREGTANFSSQGHM
jgi:hypothetical protein